MAKYSKHVIKLVNGGIFRRVVGDLFHFKKAGRAVKAADDAGAKALKQLDQLEAAAAKKWAGVTKRRQKFLGATPSKFSKTGRDVLERMSKENPSSVRNLPKGDPSTWTKAQLDRVMIKSLESGKWFPYKSFDMGHSPVDAVTYWNNVGRFTEPRSKDVRDWMLDPANYRLQLSDVNQAAGRELGAAGARYQPPLKLPDGIVLDDKAKATILDMMKNL